MWLQNTGWVIARNLTTRLYKILKIRRKLNDYIKNNQIFKTFKDRTPQIRSRKIWSCGVPDKFYLRRGTGRYHVSNYSCSRKGDEGKREEKGNGHDQGPTHVVWPATVAQEVPLAHPTLNLEVSVSTSRYEHVGAPKPPATRRKTTTLKTRLTRVARRAAWARHGCTFWGWTPATCW